MKLYNYKFNYVKLLFQIIEIKRIITFEIIMWKLMNQDELLYFFEIRILLKCAINIKLNIIWKRWVKSIYYKESY